MMRLDGILTVDRRPSGRVIVLTTGLLQATLETDTQSPELEKGEMADSKKTLSDRRWPPARYMTLIGLLVLGVELAEVVTFRLLPPDGGVLWVVLDMLLAGGVCFALCLVLVRPLASLSLHLEDAQKALALSEQGYRTIFDNAGSAIALLEADGTIAEVNRQFEMITGYSHKLACSGEKWLELFPDSPLPEVCGAAADGGPLTREETLVDAAGETRFILQHLACMGASSRVLVSFWDISIRKRAEEELKKSQARLMHQHAELTRLFREAELARSDWEGTMDAVDDWLVLLDGEGRVIRGNAAFCQYWRKEFSQLEGTAVEDLLGSLEITDGEGGGRGVLALHRKRSRWFLIDTYPFSGGDAVCRRTVLRGHDFTEMKRIHRKLEAINHELAQKTGELEGAYDELKQTQCRILEQEKMASIGQLAAGVAHEINNPVGFVLSNLGTLRKYLQRLDDYLTCQQEALATADPAEMEADLADKRKRLKVDHIRKDAPALIAESIEGAERVKKIVQDLKGFSRVDMAEQSWVELSTCLDSTINIVWNELKYKAKLVRDYADLPPVNCYPQQLNQVFLNLLINAGQAIEAEGEITVRTWVEEETACIAVSDNGRGIPPAVRQRIFEPFFTTKRVGEGTGLGLSIAYDIIQKHGGSIAVQSEEGRGANFTVRIPLAGFPPEQEMTSSPAYVTHEEPRDPGRERVNGARQDLAPAGPGEKVVENGDARISPLY